MITQDEKKDRIRKEENRLYRVFKTLDDNKKQVVRPLIQKAAFMSVSLEELQEMITEEGYLSEYQNGENQSGTKKSPAVDIYNTLYKNYNAAISLLLANVPPAARKESRLAAFAKNFK